MLKNYRGFSLIEVMVMIGIISIMMFAMMTMQNNQLKANNFLEFQLKRTQLRASIIGQFLSDSENCRCLFKDALDFPIAGIGTLALSSSDPTTIGRFSFVTPGDCSTATIPVPFVDDTGNIDGMKSTLIQMRNIAQVSPGIYQGNFYLSVQSVKEVSGPKDIPIDIQVNVTAIPSGTDMKFQGCSTAAPAAPGDKTLAAIEAKSSYTAAMMHVIGTSTGGGGGSVSTCTGGTYMYGYAGTVSGNLKSVRALCKKYDESTTYTSTLIGGDMAGGSFSDTCPAGSFAAGISQATTSATANGFRLNCRDVITSSVTYLTQAGAAGAGSFNCPAGSYLFEMRARHGSAIDRLEFICANMPP